MDGPNITTKECLYESCNVHHDKLGGGQDSRGAEQSYVMDKRTVCSLLIKSIERDYVYKRHLQIHEQTKRRTKLKQRHVRSLTCG